MIERSITCNGAGVAAKGRGKRHNLRTLMTLYRMMRSTCQRHAYCHLFMAYETTKRPLTSASRGANNEVALQKGIPENGLAFRQDFEKVEKNRLTGNVGLSTAYRFSTFHKISNYSYS